jgi:hypothetical protein
VSSKNGGHLFSNCNITMCHSVEATECWKTRINLFSSETLTEVSNEECLMGCDTALLGKWFMTFWRNMSTLSSWTDYLWRWRQHSPSKHWNHSPSDTVTQQKTRILDTTFFWMVAAHYADAAKGVRRVRRPSLDWLNDLTDSSIERLNEFIYLFTYLWVM